MNTRLAAAMGCYAVIAGLAFFTLTGDLRLLVLIVVAGFTVRTWIAYLATRNGRD
jgi:hypothetical protein